MKTTKTYGGIPAEYGKFDNSTFVVIPVPFDGTSTWVKGADKGPEALLEAASQVEFYDIELDTEVYKAGIYLDDDIDTSGSEDQVLEETKRRVAKWLKSGRIPVILGGEHSISIGSIKAMREMHDDITILQLDAHADLRPEYDGSPNNHACAMHWASQHTNLVQVGIRSMDISEKEYMEQDNVFFAQDILNSKSNEWMNDVLRKCSEKVFITIDLDVFDPAFVPSTGTPEPGGLNWQIVIKLLEKVSKFKEVVGFDVMELCPNPAAKASDFLAAKLVYKLMGYINEYRDYEDV